MWGVLFWMTCSQSSYFRHLASKLIFLMLEWLNSLPGCYRGHGCLVVLIRLDPWDRYQFRHQGWKPKSHSATAPISSYSRLQQYHFKDSYLTYQLNVSLNRADAPLNSNFYCVQTYGRLFWWRIRSLRALPIPHWSSHSRASRCYRCSPSHESIKLSEATGSLRAKLRPIYTILCVPTSSLGRSFDSGASRNKPSTSCLRRSHRRRQELACRSQGYLRYCATNLASFFYGYWEQYILPRQDRHFLQRFSLPVAQVHRFRCWECALLIRNLWWYTRRQRFSILQWNLARLIRN